MNKDRMEGNWEQFKGKMKQSWGKMGDDDFALIQKGKRQEFLGKVQERQGIAKEEAEKQLKEFEASCDYCITSDAA
jgi:uncharacterized protein YjbJ (UPF0337 family)